VTSHAADVTTLTERTRIRRLPERQVHDRRTLDDILDSGLLAHVALVDGGQPLSIPVAYARWGDQVVFHGSTGSRLFRALADGSPTCLTVTLLDGLVLARSAFESSMNYRSAMILGSCTVVEGTAKEEALEIITEHLLPDRWSDVRLPTRREMAATLVLSLPLSEWSVKVRAGGPEDPDEDVELPYWAGVVPITESFGTPIPVSNLAADIPVPAYISTWSRSPR
jgi:hypothetical protein